MLTRLTHLKVNDHQRQINALQRSLQQARQTSAESSQRVVSLQANIILTID